MLPGREGGSTLASGMPTAKAMQTLAPVFVRACKGGLLGDKLPLSALDPAAFSELVRELASLFER